MSWKVYEGRVETRAVNWINAQSGSTVTRRIPIIAENMNEANETFEHWLELEFGPSEEPKWSVEEGDVETVLKILKGEVPLSSVNRRR